MLWEHRNVQQEGERHEVLRIGVLRRAFFGSINWDADWRKRGAYWLLSRRGYGQWQTRS